MNLDFIGFSFDGVHSSYLGLQRVGDGSYYNEILQPNFENKLNTAPGHDGQYYFGSDYQDKEINIKVAFDNITELQFRQIVNLFSTKKVCQLILDERPYKMYNVKLASPINLNYICFDEPIKNIDDPREGLRVIDRTQSGGQTTITRETVYPYVYEYDDNGKKITQRIYKGEGEINFVCMSPMARAPFKDLDAYSISRLSYDIYTIAVDENLITAYNNVDEWKDASGILTAESFNSNNIDVPRLTSEDFIRINVYNPGDIDVPYLLYLPYSEMITKAGITGNFGKITPRQQNAYIYIYSNSIKTMILKPIIAKSLMEEETGVIINSENHLIEGINYNKSNDTFRKTGNVYNEYIVSGDFTTILKQDILQRVRGDNTLIKQTIGISCVQPEDTTLKPWIKYDYLYY